jgi:hypothetical protein
MSATHRHKQLKRRDGASSYIYDGRELIAVIEQHPDDLWHVIIAGRDVGACQTREVTLRLVTTISKHNRRAAE